MSRAREGVDGGETGEVGPLVVDDTSSANGDDAAGATSSGSGRVMAFATSDAKERD